MCILKAHDLPNEILEIEQNNKLLGTVTSKEIAAQFKQSALDTANESGYVKAFTKMLQFEEAAQSQYLIQFNTKELRLSRSNSDSEREFCIKNDVRIN